MDPKTGLLPLPGIEPRFLSHPACRIVAIPTEISRLLINHVVVSYSAQKKVKVPPL